MNSVVKGKINLLGWKKYEILDLFELFPADQVDLFSVLMKQSSSCCDTHQALQ